MAKTDKSSLIRQFSAGGAVYFERQRESSSAYKDEDGNFEWVIIKPSGRNQWRLPKGIIDKGETSLKAAEREVEEEAGIDVEVLGKIGQDKYFYVLGKDRIYKIVTYFLMRYIKEAKGPLSWETEQILWLPYEEAFEKLSFKGEKEILKKAWDLVQSR